MKFDRKIHFTERQLRDLSGLTIDALRVYSKTDPKFPDPLFVTSYREIVYDKDKALEWISSIEQPEPLDVVPSRQHKPLSQHGEYKPSPAMKINLERARAHQPSLITPKGFGNGEGHFGHWPGY